MSYRLLYSQFQDANVHIPHYAVRDRVLAITGVNRVRDLISGMPIEVCRGIYLSPRNTSHQFARQFGGHVIVVARGLNRCWYRFVFVKELMHMFDTAEFATDNGVTFDRLLTELGGHGSLEKCPAYFSEMKAFWMALALLCPERVRLELKEQRSAKVPPSDYAIALRLRIPELYVKNLFSPIFENEILPYLVHAD